MHDSAETPVVTAPFAMRLESVNRVIGHAIAWLTLVMAIATGIIVIERYWFADSSIALQESVTFMHAAVFMLAAGYTLAAGDHVRVDIFYSRMQPRTRALVDIAGTLLLLLPVCGFLIWSSWDYVATSWSVGETSQESDGLPYPFPSLLKSFIPLAGFLLILQGIVMLLVDIHLLTRTMRSPVNQAD
jgi:TRAP-type mannitol/chloroaromatic compound transport system permease small subunit